MSPVDHKLADGDKHDIMRVIVPVTRISTGGIAGAAWELHWQQTARSDASHVGKLEGEARRIPPSSTRKGHSLKRE